MAMEAEKLSGFPTRPGNALIKASTKFKVPKVPKAQPPAKPFRLPKQPKVKEPSGLY